MNSYHAVKLLHRQDFVEESILHLEDKLLKMHVHVLGLYIIWHDLLFVFEM